MPPINKTIRLIALNTCALLALHYILVHNTTNEQILNRPNESYNLEEFNRLISNSGVKMAFAKTLDSEYFEQLRANPSLITTYDINLLRQYYEEEQLP